MEPIPMSVKARDLVGQDVAMAGNVIVPGMVLKSEIRIPEGTVFKATGFGTALHLSGNPCPACGAAIRLRNIPRRYLSLPDTGPGPDGKPVPVEPLQNHWYDPEKNVPKDPAPVIIAWTDIYGSPHDGDRTAVYKDGTWRWASGDQEEMHMDVTVDAWMACPPRPASGG